MKARVTVTTFKRLDAIERLREQGRSRRRVVLLPAVLGIDEWEKVALESQAKLMRDAAEDMAFVQPDARTAPTMPSFGPIEGVHYRRPDPNRNQAPVPRPPREKRVYEDLGG